MMTAQEIIDALLLGVIAALLICVFATEVWYMRAIRRFGPLAHMNFFARMLLDARKFTAEEKEERNRLLGHRFVLHMIYFLGIFLTVIVIVEL